MNTEHLRSGISRHRSVSSVARIKYWRLTFLQTTFVRLIHVWADCHLMKWRDAAKQVTAVQYSVSIFVSVTSLHIYIDFWGDKSMTFRRKHAHFLTLTSGFVSKLTQLTWSTSVVLQKRSLPTFIQVNGEQLSVITRVKVGKIKQNYRSYKTVFSCHITVHVLCAG